MKHKNVQKLSGYSKLPEYPYEWDQWKLTLKEKEEHWKIMRIHDMFFNMITGYIQGIPKCRVYSRNYQTRFLKKIKYNISKIYFDYASSYISIPGFHSYNAFTRYGISQIDTAFAKEIQILGEEHCLFTADELEDCILRHPHLHPIIRNNLYSNLCSARTKICPSVGTGETSRF
jgi:hypothetical protein